MSVPSAKMATLPQLRGAAMKQEIAARLAATAVDGITVDQARAIIRAFLVELARCPLCDGSGRYVFRRAVTNGKRATHDSVLVPAGTSGSCPVCGSEDEEPVGDPEYVGWHCLRGEADQHCRHYQSDATERRNGHSACGYRIMLPLVSDAAR